MVFTYDVHRAKDYPKLSRLRITPDAAMPRTFVIRRFFDGGDWGETLKKITPAGRTPKVRRSCIQTEAWCLAALLSVPVEFCKSPSSRCLYYLPLRRPKAIKDVPIGIGKGALSSNL
jgi:hypothetical protein